MPRRWSDDRAGSASDDEGRGMTIAPAEVRAAKAIIARHRRQQREARGEPIRPLAAGQRQPRIKDPAYLAFIRKQPCCVCGKPAPSHAAHVRAGYPEAGWRATGMGEKPDDRRTLPLCAADHLDGPYAQHRTNERAWWEAQGIYPPGLAKRLARMFVQTR